MQMTWNKQQFILLPKNHPVTDLIVAYSTVREGILEVCLAKIRSKFWIIGVTRLVNVLIKKCVLCAIRYKR